MLGGGVGGKEVVCSTVQPPRRGGGPQPGQPTMGATAQRTNGPEKAIPPLTVRNQQFRRKGEGKALRVRR